MVTLLDFDAGSFWISSSAVAWVGAVCRGEAGTRSNMVLNNQTASVVTKCMSRARFGVDRDESQMLSNAES
jgi:hypothetical protein